MYIYIYDNNKTVYMLMKKVLKKCLHIFDKETTLYAVLSSKQKNF